MVDFVRLFRSRKASHVPAAGGGKGAKAETISHFTQFVASRPGCEGFIEPPTQSTQTTLLIVAGSGEWTRRKVPDAEAARKIGKKLGIDVFDVNLSGYPDRKRAWDKKRLGRAESA